MTNPRDYPDVIKSAESGRPLRRGVKMLTIDVDGEPFTYAQPGWWASLDDPTDNEGQLTDEDNLIRAAARREAKAKAKQAVLSPLEIRAIRESCGLSQQAAPRVFGGGPKAFEKYEAGEVVPSSSMTRLLLLAAKRPDLFRRGPDASAMSVGDSDLIRELVRKSTVNHIYERLYDQQPSQARKRMRVAARTIENVRMNTGPANSVSRSASILAKPETTHLVSIAKHTLEHFEQTATAARTALAAGIQGPSAAALATVNTLTNDRALRNLMSIGEDQRRDLIRLSQEPAIARVVVRDDQHREQTIFIARASGGRASNALVASYRSPLGRLAAVPVGQEDDIPTPKGVRSFEVLERALLKPAQKAGEWDSTNSVVEGREFGPLTVVSLRSLLRSECREVPAIDVLESLLEQERVSSNIIEGLRRSVIEKIGLRDQPILDQYQDEIFRLPLNRSVVILAPPGTGKTTTLIKRLGLKLDKEYLTREERRLVEGSTAGMNNHRVSWLMFTPTELLKQYLKEAFARENIPAPDERIQLWSDYRRELARNKFPVLRTSSGRSGFVLREELPSLKSEAIDHPMAWYEDFNQWQASHFWAELSIWARALTEVGEPAIAALGARLFSIVNSASEGAAPYIFIALDGLNDEITKLVSRLREDVDGRLRRAFANELRQDSRLLDDLLAFLNKLKDSVDGVDESEELDEEEDENENGARPHLGAREEAFEAYKRAARAQARAAITERDIGRRTKNGRILEWLGARSLPAGERFEVGQILQVLAALRPFLNTLRRYIEQMPARYRRFRRERQTEGTWYLAEGFSSSELNPLEVDVVLLAILRNASELLKDRRVLQNIGKAGFKTLKEVRDLYRTQIVVDEATDFSPLQIGCMAALCDPSAHSFLACGDFNQRVSSFGIRSVDELKSVLPDVDIRSISVSYRHSLQLNELAHRIVELGGAAASKAQLPKHIKNEGVDPVLAKGVVGKAAVEWLAARIIEIEKFTHRLPSIGVLVHREEEVGPLAASLGAALAGQNIRAVACPGGQVVGQDNDVRVFDVQHIKGLEFEAVFFVGVDLLADRYPKLFDKYLYVGTTRAATYLGMTCAGPELPVSIKALESTFASTWH
jgi:putative zinc finger/helix-turn-helix YgiT family protein